MKKHFALMMTLISFFAFAQVAEAKRFGGGKSFGYSKQMKPKQYNTQKAPAKKPEQAGQAAPARQGGAAAQSGASRWLGPLAGFAAGGLLAAMLFGDGFEGLQLFDILLFALIAFVLFKLFVRRRPEQQYAGHEPSYRQQDEMADNHSQQNQYRETPQPVETYNPNGGGSIIGSGLSDTAQSVEQMPEWFEEASFVEGAKTHFVAVQKAWDEVNLDSIREYCSAELFAALEQEMQLMQPNQNHTHVDTLYAEIADKAIDGQYLVVSIRFSGFIQEAANGDAHAFNEIWHIRRLAAGEGNWEIAGIQQN